MTQLFGSRLFTLTLGCGAVIFLPPFSVLCSYLTHTDSLCADMTLPDDEAVKY